MKRTIFDCLFAAILAAADNGWALHNCFSPSVVAPIPLAAPQNKVIFNYFPYPWFVSTVHVVVGAAYCIVAYVLGAKKASFERVRLVLWA